MFQKLKKKACKLLRCKVSFWNRRRMCMQTCADYLQGGPRLLTDFNIWWLLLLLTAKLEFKTYCLKAQFGIWICNYKKVASAFEECLWTFSNWWKIQQIFNFLNVELVLACTLVFNIPTKTLQRSSTSRWFIGTQPTGIGEFFKHWTLHSISKRITHHFEISVVDKK